VDDDVGLAGELLDAPDSSSTLPRRYPTLLQPCAAGSNGRLAIPITRPTVSECSSSASREGPMPPVGLVTGAARARAFSMFRSIAGAGAAG
jgi:hypothetical protein